MCRQDYRKYTCGCTKKEAFHQCYRRRGTNVVCENMGWACLPRAEHMCRKHMIKPGKDEMQRWCPKAKEEKVKEERESKIIKLKLRKEGGKKDVKKEEEDQ